MLCICCDRMITYGDDDLSEEDAIFTEIDKGKYRLKAENRLWTGGVVGNISGGYGSIHDGSKYVIGICDDCVTLKLNEVKLSFNGNFIMIYFKNNAISCFLRASKLLSTAPFTLSQSKNA